MEKTILVVDDDEQIQSFLKERLEDAGFNVLSAPDGKEGLVQAAEKKPDLILLDVEMSEMNGHDTLKRLKQNSKTREIPVIMLTGCGGPEHISKAMEGYADKFIEKPFDTKQLMEEIQKTLNILK